MGKTLELLMVEDSELDARLLIHELTRGGFDVHYERVETPEAMSEALQRKRWDVIVSDYSMPRFSAPAALALVKARDLDLPFIIVSGTVGEDVAVEAIQAGAHDFMSKGRLGRLIPAIERELRDVTLRAEQRRMQEQLVISDRMASMGTLAAGVAHEINNPLACVLGNLDLAGRTLTDLAERLGLVSEFTDVREEVDDARQATERIRSIVRDLKMFSRPQEETGPVDVERVMESTLRMAWNEIRHRARLVKNYGNTPPVEASEARLGQVFLNLVLNAAQAIAEGRAMENEIRITTSVATGGRVVIEIADTGSGMRPEVIERLFTPFFTTKPLGVGTGLGLSICHRIVTGFDGSIDVSSAPGKGTAFRVSLPAATRAPVAKEATPVASHEVAQRRGRVLLIDDEEAMTHVIRRVLSLEHEVVALASAGEALDRILAGESFDVILSDLMMPEMTGMDLHAELARVAPAQATRMIFLTGGAFTDRARAFLDEVPNLRVEKPFDTRQLRALVNDRIR